jgi:hypothetical protein
MMTRALFVMGLAMATLFLPRAVSTQNIPDLSGTWTLDDGGTITVQTGVVNGGPTPGLKMTQVFRRAQQ